MIRTYALLLDNMVVSIEHIDTNDDKLMLKKGQQYQNMVDIEDMVPQPEVTWLLVGNKLIPNAAVDSFLLQQKTAREFGVKLSGEIADLIGARNLKLSAEGSVINIASVLQQLNVLKALLDTGCLRTTVTMAAAISPSFPAYANHTFLMLEERLLATLFTQRLNKSRSSRDSGFFY